MNPNTETNPTALYATDPRPILARAIATGATTVVAVSPDQLASPTPCTEMDVRALLGHLLEVLDRIEVLGRGGDPFAIVPTSPADDGWLEAFTAAADRATAAWVDDAVLDRPMELPWKKGAGRDLLATYLNELTVHTWDLAVATGQQPDWDDDVLALALDQRDLLPAENRLALFEEIAASMGLAEVPVPFAEAVAVPDDAPAIERLVAWNGRDPRF
jgi:uncharacterized protein (TIGR03086 family)